MADTSYLPTLLPPPDSGDGEKTRRALAQALLQQGMETSPIRSPWQGGARLAQALMGGIELGRMDKERKAQLAALKSGFGAGPSIVPPPAAATVPATVAPDAETPDTPTPDAPAPDTVPLPPPRPAPEDLAPAPDGSQDQPVVPPPTAPAPGTPVADAPTALPTMAAMGQGVPGSAGSFGSLSTLGALAHGIGKVESGNNYAAVGPVTSSGDRAYGRYQVMGANVPSWTKEVLGTAMTPAEFRSDPQAQDAVFNAKMAQNLARYGNVDDATSVWFSGRPMSKAGNASDGYNTVPQYISKVRSAMMLPEAAATAGAPTGAAAFQPTMTPSWALHPEAPEPDPMVAASIGANPQGAAQAPAPALQVAQAPPAPRTPSAGVPVAPAARPDKADGDAVAAQRYVAQFQQQKAQQIANVEAQMAQVRKLAEASSDPAYLQKAQTVYQQLQAQRAQLSTQTVQTLPDGRLLVGSSDGPKIVDPRDKEKADRLPEGARKLNLIGLSNDDIKAAVANPQHPQHNLVMQTLFPKSSTSDANKVVPSGAVVVGPDGKEVYSNKPKSELDDETASFLAARVAQGDTTALIGLGRGAQGAENITKVQRMAGEISKRMAAGEAPDAAAQRVLEARADQAGRLAGARAGGTLNARIDVFAKEAETAIPLAIEASRAVPRTTWTPLNKAIQMVQSGSGDPALGQFVAANNAVINTYSKAISGGGTGALADREHAREMLSTAQSPEAYEAVLRQLQREVQVAHRAARSAKELGKQDVEGDQGDRGASVVPGAQSKSIGQVIFGGGAPAPVSGLPQPKTMSEYDKLPVGAQYIDPNGVPRTKGK